MTYSFEALLGLLVTPTLLFGNFTYLVQLSSLLMRDIAWLRVLAILAGMAKIVYRLFFVFDPVSVFWESLFLLTNVGQLLIIWWENRPPNFSAEEKYFIDTVAPDILPADARALLGSGTWTAAPVGEAITTEGQQVNALVFIASGTVNIDRAGAVVATCGPGDFLGEMTYASGKPATATATVTTPLRYLRLDRHALEQAQRARPVLRIVLHAGFNRNLIDKLLRSNASSPPKPVPVPSTSN